MPRPSEEPMKTETMQHTPLPWVQKEIVKCTEPIPSAGNTPCGQQCYQLPTKNDPARFFWMCPTHGCEKILSEPFEQIA
jgi:hypothetical protein